MACKGWPSGHRPQRQKLRRLPSRQPPQRDVGAVGAFPKAVVDRVHSSAVGGLVADREPTRNRPVGSK
eukprot:1234503-Pyramimonas_sp.AAC.1